MKFAELMAKNFPNMLTPKPQIKFIREQINNEIKTEEIAGK